MYNVLGIAYSCIYYTVKKLTEKFDPKKMTKDHNLWVSKKVSDIPVDNFAKNIKLYRQTFTNVELLRYENIPHV
jgi:hypothetical protein